MKLINLPQLRLGENDDSIGRCIKTGPHWPSFIKDYVMCWWETRGTMDCFHFTVNVTGACTMHFQRVFRSTCKYDYQLYNYMCKNRTHVTVKKSCEIFLLVNIWKFVFKTEKYPCLLAIHLPVEWLHWILCIFVCIVLFFFLRSLLTPEFYDCYMAFEA